jgi:hypothetical protein
MCHVSDMKVQSCDEGFLKLWANDCCSRICSTNAQTGESNCKVREISAGFVLNSCTAVDEPPPQALKSKHKSP